MKLNNVFLFAAAYPYTAGVIAIIWFGSAILLRVDHTLSLGFVLFVDSISTMIIAAIGFRK